MTDTADIASRLRQIISKVTGRERIDLSETTDLIEGGVLDSLDWSVFLLDVEAAFSVRIPDEEVEDNNLQVFGNLITFIASAK